jgi:hypothetical protein
MATRLRRTRALATVLLLAAVVTIGVQVSIMIRTGIVMGAWAVIGFSAVVAVIAIAALGRLAEMARRRAATAPVVRVSQPLVELMDAPAPVVEVEESITSWTPVPLPKPQYLTRSVVLPVLVPDATQQLRAAAESAELALRAAHDEPEVTPITAPAPSRWASMGVVESLDTESTDLDDILRRRRATA